MSKNIEYNENISAQELRLIDQEGKDLGIMSKKAALALAAEQDLGVVVVASTAPQPVAKICDVSKYFYQLNNKEKLQRKNPKQMQLKKINVRFCTGFNDLNTKVTMAKKFLANGDRVTFVMFLRKKELVNLSKGFDMMKNLTGLLEDCAAVEKEPYQEGSRIFCGFTPLKKK